MSIGEIYQEVYTLLCYIDENDLKKIPEDILDNIYNNRDANYRTQIDIIDLYNPDNVSDEAYELLFQLYYNFILTEEEKKMITE